MRLCLVEFQYITLLSVGKPRLSVRGVDMVVEYITLLSVGKPRRDDGVVLADK